MALKETLGKIVKVLNALEQRTHFSTEIITAMKTARRKLNKMLAYEEEVNKKLDIEIVKEGKINLKEKKHLAPQKDLITAEKKKKVDKILKINYTKSEAISKIKIYLTARIQYEGYIDTVSNKVTGAQEAINKQIEVAREAISNIIKINQEEKKLELLAAARNEVLKIAEEAKKISKVEEKIKPVLEKIAGFEKGLLKEDEFLRKLTAEGVFVKQVSRGKTTVKS